MTKNQLIKLYSDCASEVRASLQRIYDGKDKVEDMEMFEQTSWLQIRSYEEFVFLLKDLEDD